MRKKNANNAKFKLHDLVFINHSKDSFDGENHDNMYGVLGIVSEIAKDEEGFYYTLTPFNNDHSGWLTDNEWMESELELAYTPQYPRLSRIKPKPKFNIGDEYIFDIKHLDRPGSWYDPELSFFRSLKGKIFTIKSCKFDKDNWEYLYKLNGIEYPKDKEWEFDGEFFESNL